MSGTSPYAQLGYEQISAVTASTSAPSEAAYTKDVTSRRVTANYVHIVCEGTAAIRWRADGTAPSTTVGSPLTAGQSLSLALRPQDLKIIATTAGTVSISYFYAP